MRILATDRDTICALATAHGIGAISVIRISGARAIEITRKIAAFLPSKPESHKIYYGFLEAVESKRPIDEVLVSYFQEGRSFTGEDCLEISCHGSALLVDEILRNLIVAGARAAERGEFTYRAFMHGRIDLVQAESVQSLIESRSQRAAQLALRQLQGDFSKQLKEILNQMTWVLAHLEANIDFASEDIEVAPGRVLAEKTESLLAQIRTILASYKQGLIIRNGYQVALAGAPNVGKSSLLNALAGEERAIVTPVAGTTRDFVEAQLAVEGLNLTVIDTAGLRLTKDPVESIGVERSLKKLQEVDLVVYVADAVTGITPSEHEFFTKIPWEKTVFLINKTDLNPSAAIDAELEGRVSAVHRVSATTGAGLAEFKTWLTARIRGEVSEDSTLLSNARHYQGLQQLAKSLETSLPLMVQEESPDLIALELQSGLRALHEILGLVFDDQVMDKVFAEFCLGK
jgi:tRNA modification GTPase